MKSSVETLEDNKVKVYVEIDQSEFDKDVDRAFKTIAEEVKLPGFRNGKVPRKVLEARIGTAAAREQALRDGVPGYLAQAFDENDVDAINTLNVEITGGQDDGDIEFEAEVETRPSVTVAGYNGLRIELEPVDLDEDEISAAQEAELKQYGTLVDADRPAQAGDFVVMDLAAHDADGEEIIGLNVEDWSYEVGKNLVTDDFDEHIEGASVGDVLEFKSTPKGTDYEGSFKVEMKKVQTLELPEIDDAWVAENTGEFDTVEEWTASITEELREQKLNLARREISPKLSEALGELVDIELPEPLVEQEMNQQFQSFLRMLAQQGMDPQQFMQMTGQNPEQMREQMRPQAEASVKVDLGLRGVAQAEGLVATDEDVDMEFDRMAMMFGRKADDLRKVYQDNHAMAEIRSQVVKQKASDYLLEQVEIVDTKGNPIDRDVLLGRDGDDEESSDEGNSEGDQS